MKRRNPMQAAKEEFGLDREPRSAVYYITHPVKGDMIKRCFSLEDMRKVFGHAK